MAEEETVFCTNCGAKNNTKSKFCVKCGQSLVKVTDDGMEQKAEQSKTTEQASSIFDSATSRLNSWTGGSGAVKVSWKDFFSEVFKSHTEEEAEDIFIAGTKKTTPTLTEISNEKVQPWLFSRILIVIIAAGVLLSVMSNLNQNMVGDQVAVDVITCIAVPMSALVLFFEINIYKNISFYKIGKIMLLGGILSLILTLVIDNIVGGSSLNFVGATLTGLVEELSKLLIAAYFVQKLKIKRIFNGLLIGAAVGTGFAAFENIQYMFMGGQIESITGALMRTFYSIASHTEWCAIATAALVIVKGSQKLTTNTFMNPRFLKFFILVAAIHMLWDWDALVSFGQIRMFILILVTWITIFVMIHAGLREVKALQLSVKNDSEVTERG
ncbi:PrsW family glutamic-type intramembrane protease [Companilactobacillus zhachilii]|uniref:PrsW family glutamic-type intramembrane protease n=1 Tax=Companilactobacillus zhachilii TaxID=2304606 RepID=UPI004034CF01